MNTQTINTEVNALINSIEFRQHCANVAKQNGFTAKEWNDNKGMIIHAWAIEVICAK
jgi:hypothetical protein